MMKMMKRTMALLSMLFVFWGSNALAADAALGQGHIALKVDYFSFADDDWDDLGLDDGLYLGFEGFGQVADNVYLGAEFGYFNDDNAVFLTDGISTIDGEFEVTFIPVELNLKYAVAPAPHFVFDFGGGVSYSYAELEFSGTLSDPVLGVFSGRFSEDDWLFGGQIFADINFVFDAFFFGVNGKYQILEEFDEFDVDVDNWRLGGQVGFRF